MRSVTRVKICGIASLADASAAVAAGADALGFLVGLDYPTADELSAEQASELVTALPPFVTPVLVTHRVGLEQVVALCRLVNPHAVQLHGAFPLAEIPALRAELPHLKVIKAVHPMDDDGLDSALAAEPVVDAVVLDSKTGQRIGGTGMTHDWRRSRAIRDRLRVPVILAGGLNPDNVAAAVEQVQPFGVDVNTGVCEAPGRKSADKLRRFIGDARQAPVPADFGRMAVHA